MVPHAAKYLLTVIALGSHRHTHGASVDVAADGTVTIPGGGADLHLNTTEGQKVFVNGVDILGRLAAMETLVGALTLPGATPGSIISFAGRTWKLVRRVTASSSTWHQASDNLDGTASYGSPCGPTADCSFSIPFSGESFTYFLFATGNMDKWLITERCQAACSEYESSQRSILRSSTSSEPYKALWLFRSSLAEDPWISVLDHAELVVYGEASHTAHVANFQSSNGANVFISVA